MRHLYDSGVLTAATLSDGTAVDAYIYRLRGQNPPPGPVADH